MLRGRALLPACGQLLRARVPRLHAAPLCSTTGAGDALVITASCAQVRATLYHPARATWRPQPARADCAQRIVQLNGQANDSLERLLRVSVEPGGCSGFQYAFSLEKAVEGEHGEDTCGRAPKPNPSPHPGPF